MIYILILYRYVRIGCVYEDSQQIAGKLHNIEQDS